MHRNKRTTKSLTVNQRIIVMLINELSMKVDPSGSLVKDMKIEFPKLEVVKIWFPTKDPPLEVSLGKETFELGMEWTFTGILENFIACYGY